MKAIHRKLNLDRPETYQIKVPGRLDERSTDWVEWITVTVETEGTGSSITTLTGTFVDQAALQGTLRRLYSLGIPLISVNRVGPD
jgi:hypothetical protein